MNYFRVKPLVTAASGETLMADGGSEKVGYCLFTFI